MNFAHGIAALVFVAALSSCSTTSSNMRLGNDMSYASLGDQRAASQTIQVLDAAPVDAQRLGEVEASRCHREHDETSPTEQILMLDLKIAAYAMGADAITNVSVTKKSALLKNCWWMVDGRAQALRLLVK